MSADKKKTYLFDNPRNVRRVVFGLVGVCVILVGLDLVAHRHVSHPWETMFGFYAVYGFVACVLLVLLAKEMRKLLIRKEDYYDEAPPTDDLSSGEDPRA
jgi:hypothetical protein